MFPDGVRRQIGSVMERRLPIASQRIGEGQERRAWGCPAFFLFCISDFFEFSLTFHQVQGL